MRRVGLLGAALVVIALCAGCIPVWSVSSPQTEGAGSVLESVSCTSPTWCMAVGSFTENPPTDPAVQETLTERYDGTNWTVLPSPGPGENSILYGVSCSSPTFCLAVGTSDGTSGTNTLVETYNGTEWTVAPNPEPVVGAGEVIDTLSYVSCTSPTFCAAIGIASSSSTSSGFETLAATYDGTTWTVDTIAPPTGLAGSPVGVSCTSATWCMFMSLDEDAASNTRQNNVDIFDGSSWTPIAPSAESALVDPGSALTTLSCSNPTSCVAVGTYEPPTSGTVSTRVDTYDGSDWSQVPSSSPNGEPEFHTVSCADPSFCAAVGNYQTTSGAVQTLVETTGATGAWTVSSSPSPRSANSLLFGISCATESACVGVGYDGAFPDVQSLALTGGASTPPLVVSTTSLDDATVGTSYSATLTASNGVTPYTWSLVSGDLPDGLSLSPSGVISGTPVDSGTSSFTVAATDAGALPVYADADLSISVENSG